MPTPPPLSTLFPYTTLFRSPIASPLTEKEQQSLLLEAETLLDIPQALLPLPSAVPFSQKWRRPQRWLLLKPSARGACRRNQSRPQSCGAAARDHSPERCSHSHRRKSHCSANAARAARLRLHRV